jgi:hypothetical protein
MSSDPHDNGRTSVYIHFQVFCSKTLDVELCQGVLITMTTRTFVYVHFQVFGNKTYNMEGYFGKFKILQFVKKKNISKENILHFVFL